MNNKKTGDHDESLVRSAAEGEYFICFFCDKQTTNPEEMASAPEGSSQQISDMYLCRPRCVTCETEMHGHKANGAKELFDSFVSWLKPERSADEKTALDEIFAEQDHEALSIADVDRLADEKSDGRFWP